MLVPVQTRAEALYLVMLLVSVVFWSVHLTVSSGDGRGRLSGSRGFPNGAAPPARIVPPFPASFLSERAVGGSGSVLPVQVLPDAVGGNVPGLQQSCHKRCPETSSQLPCPWGHSCSCLRKLLLQVRASSCDRFGDTPTPRPPKAGGSVPALACGWALPPPPLRVPSWPALVLGVARALQTSWGCGRRCGARLRLLFLWAPSWVAWLCRRGGARGGAGTFRRGWAQPPLLSPHAPHGHRCSGQRLVSGCCRLDPVSREKWGLQRGWAGPGWPCCEPPAWRWLRGVWPGGNRGVQRRAEAAPRPRLGGLETGRFQDLLLVLFPPGIIG